MEADFEEFVARVKEATALEDVINGSGAEYSLKSRRGNSMRGESHDSLVVRVDEQYYVWNSKGERGDVFNWLAARNHWDFMTSLTWLAERAKIEMPRRMNQGDGQARVSARAREDVFGIGQKVFAGLLWGDEAALGYCRGRGWSDETIREAGLGFTGHDPAAAVKLVKGELGLYELDAEGKEAVGLIGYKGDVRGWGRRYEVEVQEAWVDWGMVPGIVGRKRIVYPHLVQGKVRYFSARNVFGSELNSEGREVKSWNLPVVLGGKRQVFFNQVYGRKAEEVVLVEGQADAITLGQWGVAAVALAGTSWEDHVELLKALRERHRGIYLALDNDEAGLKALVGRDGDWPLAEALGGMCRVVQLVAGGG